MPFVLKDPDAVLDYVMDIRPWLALLDVGTTVVDQEVLVSGDPTATVVSSAVVNIGDDDDSGVAWRLSGGTVGARPTVTVRATLSDGQVDDQSIPFVIAQR